MNKLTAIVPTGNEEKNIERVLRTVSFADEIMVVDSFSTDRTVELARKYTDFIVQREYGYSASQKNWAIPQASHEWILLVDADEWVPETLRNEIREILEKGTDKVGFWIRRSNYFMGKRLRYSGWQNDRVIRLFRKSKCRYEDKMVHAGIRADGSVGVLCNALEHDTWKGFDAYIVKVNRYATWRAIDDQKRGIHANAFHLIIKPLFRFFKHYFMRGGFLDGVPGLTACYLSSYEVFTRYVRLWLLNSEKHLNTHI
jgi:glycosyltransferase involved in cell wall biosynthesis